jgi:hypothetical protein
VLCVWLAGLCAALAAGQPVLAKTVRVPPASDRKAVIVVLHGVSWEELLAAKSPPLQGLLHEAAVGVMNTRRLGSTEQFAPYVAIGAGRGAVTDRRNPRVSDEELTWFITHPQRERMPYMQRLREANRLAHTQAEPGLLASLLHQEGRRSGYLWVFPGKTRRLGSAIAMDRSGGVDWMGQTSPREQGPTREATVIREGLRHSDLIVVDVSIADALVRGRLRPPTPNAPDAMALSILMRLNLFFRDVAQMADPARDLLIITSPTCPPYRSLKQISYSPIAVIGPGFGPGLLTSASTRRTGLVANSDIAPTILQYFGIDERRASSALGVAPMSGHAMTVRASDRPLDRILAFSRQGSRLYDLQWRFAPVYALSQFFAFMGVGAALVLVPGWARRSRRRLRLILLLAMAVPLALFFLGPLDAGGAVAPYLTVAALACAFAWFAFAGSAPLTAAGALLTATAGGIAIDAVTGGHLLGQFMMNFGVMSASRFYGIGNETMGAMVACTAIGGPALVQQAGRGRVALWALGLWMIVIAGIIAAPWWGANWGGGVTAAFAFAVAYAGVRAGRPRLRHWLLGLAAAAIIGGLGIAAALSMASRAWSHIGDSARLVGSGGVPAALTLMARKLEGNFHIMTVAPYTIITLFVLLTAIWLTLKPPAGLRAVFERNGMLWAGIAGAAAGGLMAVLVNDSGIVAASSVLGLVGLAIPYAALLGDGGARMAAIAPNGPEPQPAGVPAAPGPRTRDGEAAERMLGNETDDD